MPQEYTPELSDQLLEKLTQGIDLEEARNVGNARSEALARGVEGSAIESSGVNSARQAGSLARANTNADFAFNVAGLSREERLGQQSRGYQVEDRNFAASEAEKDRAFRQKMGQMGYDAQSARDDTAYRRDYQSSLWNAGAKGLLAGLGGL